MNIKSLFISAVMSGFVMALVAYLPYIWMVNCLICMGVWGSGIFGAWLYKKRESGFPVTPSQGAVVGGLSGIVASVIGLILGILFGSAGMNGFLESQIAGTGGMDSSWIPSAGYSMMNFFFSIVIYPFFGAIGGAIGGTVFGK
ncbi:MAG: hypothetical protein HYU84_02555 [Chloroflexi bacterium]|nr:hypothetical protein [Chloroflexota bacterium]